jgi:ABC-type siderophore export system fused ATPase/permease subunit
MINEFAKNRFDQMPEDLDTFDELGFSDAARMQAKFPAFFTRKRGFPWKPLLIPGVFPRQLWLIIPLLSFISTLLCVATSLTLKGADLKRFNKSSIIIALLALLLLITLSKIRITYLRQRTLTRMNSIDSEKLVSRFIASLTRHTTRMAKVSDIKIISSFLTEISRIQLAFYTIVSVMLAEGLIIVAILSFLCYETPAIYLLFIAYLITLLYYTNYQLPAISYLYAHVQKMEYNVEDHIKSTIVHNAESSHVQRISLPKLAVYNHGNYLNDTRDAAFRMGKVGFFYELIVTLLVTSAIVTSSIIYLCMRPLIISS